MQEATILHIRSADTLGATSVDLAPVCWGRGHKNTWRWYVGWCWGTAVPINPCCDVAVVG